MWWENLQLHNYLNDIESRLTVQSYRPLDTSFSESSCPEIYDRSPQRHVRNQDLFDLPPPVTHDYFVDNMARLIQSGHEQDHFSARVESLLATLEGRVSARHEQEYLNDLRDSIAHLDHDSQTQVLAARHLEDFNGLLQHYRDACKEQVQDLFNGLIQASNRQFEVAALVSHALRVSQRFYLQQLSHPRWHRLSRGGRNTLCDMQRHSGLRSVLSA